MKKCSKCEIEKELSEFYKKKSSKDGYRSECKECAKKYSELNKERITKYRKSHYNEIKVTEVFKEYRKKWHEDNKDKNIIKSKEYNRTHKEEIAITKDKYYSDNREKILDKMKDQYKLLKENELLLSEKRKRDKINMRIWRERNKEVLSNRIKERKKNDPLYKLSDSIRTLIWNSITKIGYVKNSRTNEILGCLYEEFKLHIESLFIDEMSWENYGEWHFDHKVPISWAKTEEEVYKLNHYTNFQPLWARDNLSKGNKWSD